MQPICYPPGECPRSRSPLLRLHPQDNVLTILMALPAGTELTLPGAPTVRLAQALTLGHKIAARPISAAEKIIKYGVPIGSATREIAAGEHVHTHNVQSDYLPTYLREDHGRLYVHQQQQSQRTSSPP